MKKIYSTIIILFFIWIDVTAQVRFSGLSVSGVYTINESATSGFPGFPVDDITFSPSNAINFDINVFAEYDFYKGIFAGAEFGYYQPELKYNGDEFIKIIVDKIPIDGTITHDVNVYINWLYPAIFVGYRYKSLSLALGNKFNFVLSSGYEHKQAITEPDSMIFINPGAQASYDDADINGLVYMPFVRFTYDIGRDLFPSSLFDAQVDVEYSLNINPVSDNYNYKLSNIKLGINVGFDFTKRADKVVILRDTLYNRDTLINYSFNVTEPKITLVNRLVNNKREREAEVWHYTTTIAEQYNLELPKPPPLLNGELRTVFIEQDSSEVQECILSYSKQLVVRHYPTIKNSKVTSEISRDTIGYIDIPSVRFYPSVISEAGLDSMIINLYSGGQLLTKVISTDEQQEFIEINLEDLIKNNTNQSLDYELILIDIEGQKKTAAKGNIILKSKISDVYNITELYYIDLTMNLSDIFRIMNKLHLTTQAVKAYSPNIRNEKMRNKIKKIQEKYPMLTMQKFDKSISESFIKEGGNNSHFLILLPHNK